MKFELKVSKLFRYTVAFMAGTVMNQQNDYQDFFAKIECKIYANYAN